MAFSHGKNAYFLWNAVALTTYTKDVKFPQSADTADTSTMGTSAKTRVVGLTDSKVSASGLWDPQSSGIDATLGAALGTSATFSFGPAGNTSGYVKYTGTAILTKYDASASIGGAAGWSAEWEMTGAITRTTF